VYSGRDPASGPGRSTSGPLHHRHRLGPLPGRNVCSDVRTITVSAATVAALEDHRKKMLAEGHCRPDAPVFCGVRRGQWLRKSDLHRHRFRPIIARAGVKCRFHDLRHVSVLRTQPWSCSTGPKTPPGKRQSATNGKKRQVGPISIREHRAELKGVRDLVRLMSEVRRIADDG
jgi:hypothetical protein